MFGSVNVIYILREDKTIASTCTVKCILISTHRYRNIVRTRIK